MVASRSTGRADRRGHGEDLRGQQQEHRRDPSRPARPARAGARRDGRREDRGAEPRVFGEVPHRRGDDLGGGAGWRPQARLARADDRRADEREHRHRARLRRRRARLPDRPHDARDDVPRAPPHAAGVRRRARAHGGVEGDARGDREGGGDRRERSEEVLLAAAVQQRSEEHTSELQSHHDLVCRLLLEKKKKKKNKSYPQKKKIKKTKKYKKIK